MGSQNKMKILCMGSINMDLVMFMERLPIGGETVVTDNFSTFPGGKGGNQAAAAALLGGDVSYFGKLGDDDFSDQLITSLQATGIDTTGIIRETDVTAGIAIIRVDAEGQNSISFTPGANVKLTPKDALENEDLFKEADILLITMEISVETVYQAIKIAKKNNMFVILDPAPAPKDKIPADICKLVDIVKPNETEASVLTGITVTDEDTAKAAALSLKEMGFKHPIVTLGEKGFVYIANDELHKIAPVKVDVVDSTAAGDVFSGSIAARISNGMSIPEALAFAAKAAALSTTVKGAQTSIPILDQVLS